MAPSRSSRPKCKHRTSASADTAGEWSSACTCGADPIRRPCVQHVGDRLAFDARVIQRATRLSATREPALGSDDEPSPPLRWFDVVESIVAVARPRVRTVVLDVRHVRHLRTTVIASFTRLARAGPRALVG